MIERQQTASAVSVPELEGYVVERALGPRAWLALDESGRRVVLKELVEDCLMRGQLHPMISDRLEHVRHLAHFGVAQLYGVVRVGARALLVWEYVEGETLEEVRSDPKVILEEFIRHVETLHALGIVHGAIHERNVIVEPSGKVKLTHVSPLLYSEPAGDVQAAIELAGRMGVVDEVRTLRELGEAIRAGQVAEDREEPGPLESDAGRRWGLVVLALVLAGVGAGLAWWIWRFATRLSTEL